MARKDAVKRGVRRARSGARPGRRSANVRLEQDGFRQKKRRTVSESCRVRSAAGRSRRRRRQRLRARVECWPQSGQGWPGAIVSASTNTAVSVEQTLSTTLPGRVNGSTGLDTDDGRLLAHGEEQFVLTVYPVPARSPRRSRLMRKSQSHDVAGESLRETMPLFGRALAPEGEIPIDDPPALLRYFSHDFGERRCGFSRRGNDGCSGRVSGRAFWYARRSARRWYLFQGLEERLATAHVHERISRSPRGGSGWCYRVLATLDRRSPRSSC